jgi:hypothetical protein
MTGIKLSKLPERAPVRLTVNVSPDVGGALGRYADFYAVTYGQKESTANLAAAIIDTFLKSDKAFTRWCRDTTDRNE